MAPEKRNYKPDPIYGRGLLQTVVDSASLDYDPEGGHMGRGVHWMMACRIK